MDWISGSEVCSDVEFPAIFYWETSEKLTKHRTDNRSRKYCELKSACRLFSVSSQNVKLSYWMQLHIHLIDPTDHMFHLALNVSIYQCLSTIFPIIWLSFGDYFTPLLLSFWQSIQTSQAICSVDSTTTIQYFSHIFGVFLSHVNALFRHCCNVMGITSIVRFLEVLILHYRMVLKSTKCPEHTIFVPLKEEFIWKSSLSHSVTESVSIGVFLISSGREPYVAIVHCCNRA